MPTDKSAVPLFFVKQQAITKLELQAAVFGASLAKFIRRERRIDISSTHMWFDSTTALQWIQESAIRQQIFVTQRVAELLESTQACQWKYCLNPADDGTRGIPLSEFSNKSRLFTGSKFLCESECNWPKLQLNDANTDILKLNDRTGHMDEIAKTPVLVFQASPEKTVQSFIDYNRFSKWTRILRTTAYLMRALRIFKDKDYTPLTKTRQPN